MCVYVLCVCTTAGGYGWHCLATRRAGFRSARKFEPNGGPTARPLRPRLPLTTAFSSQCEANLSHSAKRTWQVTRGVDVVTPQSNSTLAGRSRLCRSAAHSCGLQGPLTAFIILRGMPNVLLWAQRRDNTRQRSAARHLQTRRHRRRAHVAVARVAHCPRRAASTCQPCWRAQPA